jgi:hypothetical protein
MPKTHNKTGRSKGNWRFAAVPHYVMDHQSRLHLSLAARCIWLEFVRLHNGSNNGMIAMPARTLANRLGICKTTAAKYITELVTFGFLKRTKASSFSGKRRAAEYLLTHRFDWELGPEACASAVRCSGFDEPLCI